MLLIRKNSQNLTQHRPSNLLYTKISHTYRPQENRASSAHESRPRASKQKSNTDQHSLTLDQPAPKRRVAFQSVNFEPKPLNSLKKIKLIINNKPEPAAPKPSSLKVFRSLDSSFICIPDNRDNFPSKRSIKSSNPELAECKRLTEDILIKLAVFEDSKFCPKQLTGWIVDYFHR
jgi:hypothetical protein